MLTPSCKPASSRALLMVRALLLLDAAAIHVAGLNTEEEQS